MLNPPKEFCLEVFDSYLMQTLGTNFPLFLISLLPRCAQQEFAIAVVDMGTLCKAV